MHCTNCGILLKADSKFCPECGTKVVIEVKHESKDEIQDKVILSYDSPNQYQDSSSSSTLSSSESNEELLRKFVGAKSNYYIKKWSSSSNPSKGSGWNWAAFFLTVFWLGYRKMYKYAFLYIFIWVVLGVLFEVLKLDSFMSLLGIAVSCSLGVSGNALYYTFAKQTLQKEMNGQLQKPLERNGGTSWGGVWAAIGGILIYAVIISLITSSPNDKPLVNGEAVTASSHSENDQTKNTDARAKEDADAKAKADADEKKKAEAEAKAKAEDAEKHPNWNVKEIYADKNGNISLAINLLKVTGDISQQEIVEADAGDVFKAPWNYYGKAIKFTGTVGIVQDYPPGSDVAKAGVNSEVVLVDNDGTLIDAASTVSSGKIKVGDQISFIAYPVGLISVTNKLGGKTDELAIVTNKLQ